MLDMNFKSRKVVRRKVKKEPPVSLHGYDHDVASKATARSLDRTSLTQQHLKDEVDINTIVRRFGVTGTMPFGREQGVFGDFTEIHDLDSAIERVTRARDAFMTLPPEVRERFQNDPLEMWRQSQSLSATAFAEQVKPNPVVPDPAAPPVVPPSES